MIDVVESETTFRERTKSPEELYERLLSYMGSWIILDYSVPGFPRSFHKIVGNLERINSKEQPSPQVQLTISGETSTLYLTTDTTAIFVRAGDGWKTIQPSAPESEWGEQ